MDLTLSPVQQDLARSFGKFFADHSPTDRVRGAEPLGFDPDLWSRLCTLDVIGMAADGDPGARATLSDLVVVATEYGRHLAPAPLPEAIVAARALARAGHDPDPDLLSGTRIATFMPREAVAGTCELVPGGAIADEVVVLSEDSLCLSPLEGVAPRHSPRNLGCTALATVRLSGQPSVLAEGGGAAIAFAAALDDWKILCAAALAGLAESALDLAVGYVKDRHVFGLPIGWYQSVAHRLADDVTELDAAQLLVHEAAWAVDTGQPRASGLAAMAFIYTSELAQKISADCLHFHGGSGYTLECDAQLYFRRAKAWPLALDDPAAHYGALADQLFPRPRSKEVPDGLHA